MGTEYLGYRDGDAATPFGVFFEPEMAELPRHVVAALEHGPQAEPTLLAFDDTHTLDDEGYHQTENGYGLCRDGSVRVAVLTDMPEVTPVMWEWWFGWHGSDARRYKLWHPRAHVSAAWQDGDDRRRRGSARYVGRTSLVTEYIGSSMLRAAIRFVPPSAFGLPAADSNVVPICARLGSSDVPVDAGWLVHHIRPTSDGSEMRSRFWLGGPHIAVRKAPGVANRVARPVASRILGATVDYARDLLVHCAQEMNHLAAFLPALYEQFGGE
ncbi:MAG: hypothetical protein QOH60_4722 [Mycobacterium sp.]|jgi:hypothetical protein|nr:hypothetical protein [Mycobacterium sp.]